MASRGQTAGGIAPSRPSPRAPAPSELARTPTSGWTTREGSPLPGKAGHQPPGHPPHAGGEVAFCPPAQVRAPEVSGVARAHRSAGEPVTGHDLWPPSLPAVSRRPRWCPETFPSQRKRRREPASWFSPSSGFQPRGRRSTSTDTPLFHSPVALPVRGGAADQSLGLLGLLRRALRPAGWSMARRPLWRMRSKGSSARGVMGVVVSEFVIREKI